jgi:hypothetical protein
MSGMSRPCFHRCTQIALAAWISVAASACGKGLFTTRPLVERNDGGTGSDRPADRAVDVPLVRDGSEGPAVDVYADQGIPLDSAGPDGTGPDGPADAPAPDAPAPDGPGPGSTVTRIIDSPGGDVPLADARFSATVSVPRNAFAQPTIVTLTLISADGSLGDQPGAIGPIFSLSKTDALLRPATLQKPAVFELRFAPVDTSIPAGRVALAYLDTQSNPNLWIVVSGSSYDATTGVLTGSVFEFSETRLFAPVLSCLTGQACPDPETCGGGACQ